MDTEGRLSSPFDTPFMVPVREIELALAETLRK